MHEREAPTLAVTYQTWPIVNGHHLHWGEDASGQMWVTLCRPDGTCHTAVPYKTYLEMEDSLRRLRGTL